MDVKNHGDEEELEDEVAEAHRPSSDKRRFILPVRFNERFDSVLANTMAGWLHAYMTAHRRLHRRRHMGATASSSTAA
jgi:hypothetical protein